PVCWALGPYRGPRAPPRLHEPWKPLGDPANDEERSAHVGPIERVKQPPRGRLDARGERRPSLESKRLDAAHVEPLFKIDGERVVWVARPDGRRGRRGDRPHAGSLLP